MKCAICHKGSRVNRFAQLTRGERPVHQACWNKWIKHHQSYGLTTVSEERPEPPQTLLERVKKLFKKQVEF